MMFYIIVFLISCAFVFFSNIYWQQDQVAWVFLFLAVFYLPFNKNTNFKINPDSKYSAFIAIPTALIIFIVPYPYNLGFALLSLGIIIAFLFPLKPAINRISFSFLTTGIIWIVLSLIIPLYYVINCRYHQIGGISIAVEFILKLFSLEVYREGSNLYIQSLPDTSWITVTMEKLGLYFSLLFFAGSSIVIILFKRQKRAQTVMKLFLIQLAYVILRFTFLTLLYLNYEKVSLFWNRWVEIITFLPLVYILIKFLPIEVVDLKGVIRFEKFSYNKKQLYAIIYVFLFVFLTVALFLFPDPGNLKNGRLLLDEKHSDWEWTEEKFDTTWYGKKSCYNYYCLADYIGHYYQLKRNFDIITDEVLKEYDLLIIKTPTSLFAEDEIRSIKKFVNDGGGLLLIGDHTNVFGTSTFINPIANQFGLHFNYDCTYDFKTGSLSVYKPSRFYSHPVVQSMPTFLFGTSCTLQAPLLADNVMIGYGLKSVYLDYSQKNFFSTQNETTSMNYGLFLQSAGIKYGKGRVLAFTDSTVFSNFWIFMPGKPELFLGFLNWLNRSNSLWSLKLFLILIIAVVLWLAIKKIRKNNISEKVYLIIGAGGLAFILSYFAFSLLNSTTYSLPEPHTNYYRISVDNEYSTLEMPILSLTFDVEDSYNTFYLSMQRLGYFPGISGSLEDALDKNDLVIIINPEKDFTQKMIKKITAFVDNGGKLLILQNDINNNLTSGQILSTFKADFRILSEEGFPSLSYSGKGDGGIYVMNDSKLLNDINMGNSNAIPNNDQQKNYRLAYDIIDYIVTNK